MAIAKKPRPNVRTGRSSSTLKSTVTNLLLHKKRISNASSSATTPERPKRIGAIKTKVAPQKAKKGKAYIISTTSTNKSRTRPTRQEIEVPRDDYKGESDSGSSTTLPWPETPPKWNDLPKKPVIPVCSRNPSDNTTSHRSNSTIICPPFMQDQLKRQLNPDYWTRKGSDSSGFQLTAATRKLSLATSVPSPKTGIRRMSREDYPDAVEERETKRSKKSGLVKPKTIRALTTVKKPKRR